MSEIGRIAHMLLTQVQELHSKSIIMKYLAPQFITVSKGFDGGWPDVHIVGVELMILADSFGEDHASKLSGVNMIYLAPEYYYGHAA